MTRKHVIWLMPQALCIDSKEIRIVALLALFILQLGAHEMGKRRVRHRYHSSSSKVHRLARFEQSGRSAEKTCEEHDPDQPAIYDYKYVRLSTIGLRGIAVQQCALIYEGGMHSNIGMGTENDLNSPGKPSVISSCRSEHALLPPRVTPPPGR